jgi:hypothetical protein
VERVEAVGTSVTVWIPQLDLPKSMPDAPVDGSMRGVRLHRHRLLDAHALRAFPDLVSRVITAG